MVLQRLQIADPAPGSASLTCLRASEDKVVETKVAVGNAGVRRNSIRGRGVVHQVGCEAAHLWHGVLSVGESLQVLPPPALNLVQQQASHASSEKQVSGGSVLMSSSAPHHQLPITSDRDESEGHDIAGRFGRCRLVGLQTSGCSGSPGAYSSSPGAQSLQAGP